MKTEKDRKKAVVGALWEHGNGIENSTDWKIDQLIGHTISAMLKHNIRIEWSLVNK